MSNHNKALKKIKELVEQFGKDSYIFRGTTTRYSPQKRKGKNGKFIYDGINSTLYRWVVKEKKKKEGNISGEKDTLREIFDGRLYFHPARMERDIVERARTMFPGNTQEHEILTDLQHFGGKTNMIDFSRNMYIALFFACQGDFERPGEIIALRENKEEFKKIKTINYGKRPQKGTIEIIEPAGAQDSRQRVHFQSSVFVRPADGFINRELYERNKIEKELKKPLMEYLRDFQNLTADTIYKDIYGFVNNERNNETASLYFHLGEASSNRGKYQKAIKYYSECLNLAGSSDRVHLAYNGRGLAYYRNGNCTEAINDYDESIRHNPNYGPAYYNRAEAKKRNGKMEEAKADFAKAKELGFILPEEN